MISKRNTILFRVMSIVAVIVMLFTMTAPASIMAKDVKEKSARSGSQSLAQYLGYDPAGVVRELEAHEADNYYLGTPYRGLDINNPMPLEKYMCPNGSSYNTPAYGAGMNCTGFVGYVLQSQGADLNKTNNGTNNVGGYVNVYNWIASFKAAGVDMVAFNNANELLSSGMASKGDVIIMDPPDHSIAGVDGHIGIFWGNSSSDNRMWHSSDSGDNHISAITPKSTPSVFYLFRSSGKLQIAKKSANSSITDGNACYTLAGAEFNVYNKGTDNVVGKLTTKADGKSEELSLAPGDYEVQEIKAPNGYVLPDNPPRYSVTVSSGQINDYYVKNPIENEPGSDPIRMIVGKLDSETELGVAQGGASVANAEFTVEYYDAQYKTVGDVETANAAPKRIWIFKTDEKGRAYLDDESKIAGDELYYTQFGMPTVPWGTLVIQETKAPEGYLLETANGKAPEKHFINFEHDIRGKEIVEYNPPEQPDQIKRADVKGTKVGGKDQVRMANIIADLCLLDANGEIAESHPVVTDENGQWSTESSWNKHGNNTNRGETSEDGIWFGEPSALREDKGALIYGKYRFKERRTEANEGYDLLDFTFDVYKDNVVVDLGTLTDHQEDFPIIKTLFLTSEDGKELDPRVDQILIDKVSQTIPDGKVDTELFYATQFLKIDKDGIESVVGETNSSYISKDNEETFNVEFEYKAGMLNEGEHIVATHIVYLDEDHKNEYTRHFDLENEDQTLTAVEPKIETLFVTSEGGKELDPTVDQTLIDKVTQTVPDGKVGTELFYVTQFHKIDKDGKQSVVEEISSSYTSKTSGDTFNVEFEYKAGMLNEGEHIVATHVSYLDKDHKEEYMRHFDLDNKKQTLTASKKPSVVKKSAPATGIKNNRNLYLAFAAGLLVISIGSAILYRRMRTKRPMVYKI